jgi:hypothetical protein
MPETKTTARAGKAKSPSTQAGEYVREEIEHVREGKARRAFRQTGDCHRAIQSTKGGCETTTPALGESTEGKRQQAQSQTIPGNARGAEARRQRGGLARGAFTPRPKKREATRQCEP